MAIVLACKVKGRQFFLCEGDRFNVIGAAVLPGTPRDPLNPPEIMATFADKEAAEAKIRSLRPKYECSAFDLTPEILTLMRG